MEKDRKSLVKGVMYLIRDVLYYSELLKLQKFLNEIIVEKIENEYTNC